jgi:flagellar hook-length control protein FliK
MPPPGAGGEGAAAARAVATLVAALPEPAVVREFRPMPVELPSATPGLDTPAADTVHAQIVRSMRLQWTGGAGEARVSLRPEYLGEVTASIRVDQGVVTATLHADTPEVRRVLEAQTATLRDALVEHGLRLDRIVIAEPETPAGDGRERHARPRGRQPQAPPRRPRRDADDAGSTFQMTTDE